MVAWPSRSRRCCSPTCCRSAAPSPNRSVRAETLARYTGKLTLALCAILDTKGQGARRLDLLFHRVDNRIEAIRVGTARPVRDAKRLTRLLCDRLETIDPGFGVELMTLTAVITEPLAYRPAATALGEAPEPDISGLVDTLVGRVGGEHLHRFAAVESDLPERSVRKVAAAGRATPGSLAAHWPRPARLLPDAGADRDPGPAAGSSARLLHLARHPPPGEARRRAGAGLRRVVAAATPSWPPCATTSRSRPRPASASGCFATATARMPAPARSAGSCMACSDELRRAAVHVAFLVPARRQLVRGAVRPGGRARHRRPWRSPTATASPASSARTRRRRSPGVRLIVGCRLDLTDGASLLVYPTDRPAYGRLCRLLSLGKRRGGKARCLLGWEDVAQYARGPDRACSCPTQPDATCAAQLRRMADIFGDRAHLALTLRRRPRDQLRLHQLAAMAAAARVAHRRHQRRAVPRAGPAHPAGCRHLHPARLHHRRRSASAASAMPTAT